MYIPASNAAHGTEAMHDFMDAHPLAALVTVSGDGIFATHLPLLLDRAEGSHGTLRGHVARANSHHRLPLAMPEALVIFSGPNAYVSPAWYPSKAETGKVVPTWNYVAVHAYGQLRFIDDETFLRQHVDALTTRHESGRAAPWSIRDAPADYVGQQLRAIVGVELAISRLEGRWKMSQNRSATDVDGVVQGLGSSSVPSDRAVADIVARVRPR